MEFVITEYKNCALMEISGRVDSYTSPMINDALESLIADGHCKLVLNLENVTYLSSSGMLTFINALKHCQQGDQGKIILANVPPQIYSNLELAGFHELFEIYGDVLTAVGKF